MSSNLSNNNEITPMENPDSPFEEVGNWLKLPCDLMLMILIKVGPFDILQYAQFVCKLWHNFFKKPALWRTIHIRTLDEPERMHQYKRMMVNVVDRSAGGLIDLSIEGFGSDGLFLIPPLHLTSPHTRLSQLKRLRLAKCDGISEKALVEALEKLSCLEELELTLCNFENVEAVSIIKSCPSLTTFRFNNLGSKSLFLENDDEALAIAASMPQLCHLQLIGNNMTNIGLTAILDSCRHLQSLDLRACFRLDLTGDLGKRLLEQIKDLRRPCDSTEDYNYPTATNPDFEYPNNFEIDEAFIHQIAAIISEI